jgi:hypothetical protein
VAGEAAAADHDAQPGDVGRPNRHGHLVLIAALPDCRALDAIAGERAAA